MVRSFMVGVGWWGTEDWWGIKFWMGGGAGWVGGAEWVGPGLSFFNFGYHYWCGIAFTC